MEGGGGEAGWAWRAAGVQAWRGPCRRRAVWRLWLGVRRWGTVLMPAAPRRPSGPAGVPVRRVAGAFAGTGIWPPTTVLSPSG